MKSTTAIGAGLFAAWAVHDAEEWLTMAPTSRSVFRSLPDFLPIPKALRQHGLSQTHVNLSLVFMSVPVALASITGIVTEGRSKWFQAGLLAFGVHGFTHIGSSIARRGYTTGVATAPLIVIPYWVLAKRELSRLGIEKEQKAPLTALVAIPLTLGVHLASAAILREKSLGAARAHANHCRTA